MRYHALKYCGLLGQVICPVRLIVHEAILKTFFLLLDRLRSGDPTAIREFLDCYGDVIRRELRFHKLDRRLRHVVSESDLVQSILVRLYFELISGQFSFEAPEKLIEFLKIVTRAKVVNVARHWTAQRRDMRRNVPLHDGELVDRGSETKSPSDTMMTAELLQAALGRLSDRELMILKWRQEGKTWGSIARCVEPGVTADQIRKQHERAVSRLARELMLDEDTP